MLKQLKDGRWQNLASGPGMRSVGIVGKMFWDRSHTSRSRKRSRGRRERAIWMWHSIARGSTTASTSILPRCAHESQLTLICRSSNAGSHCVLVSSFHVNDCILFHVRTKSPLAPAPSQCLSEKRKKINDSRSTRLKHFHSAASSRRP